MTSYLQRIEAIKARADQLAAARAKRARDMTPFCELIFDEILGDGAVLVTVHPQGCRGKTRQWSGTLKEAFDFIDGEKIEAFADMIYNPLWAHVFFQKSPLYTDAQKTVLLEQDKEKYPEVAQLYNLDDPNALIDFLAAVPQFLTFLPHTGFVGSD